jgi:hypothetical protein
VYLNLSGDWLTSPGTETLGCRITGLLPHLCEKYNGSVLIACESSQLPGSHDENVYQLLVEANAFAVVQLNGVPDRMPL